MELAGAMREVGWDGGLGRRYYRQPAWLSLSSRGAQAQSEPCSGPLPTFVTKIRNYLANRKLGFFLVESSDRKWLLSNLRERRAHT